MTRFRDNKELIYPSLDEYDRITALQRKLRNGDVEARIMGALELATCCHHFIVNEFPWRFTIDLQKGDLPIMKALTSEVKEYLDNNNTVRFGFCPMRSDGKPVKEELATLYLKDIDTYNKTVKYCWELFYPYV